jgi:hypothetical protein
MITRIAVSLVAGWFVGIGVPPSVGYVLGNAAGSAIGVGGTTVGTATAAVDAVGTVVGGAVRVGADAQAATKIPARKHPMI